MERKLGDSALELSNVTNRNSVRKISIYLDYSMHRIQRTSIPKSIKKMLLIVGVAFLTIIVVIIIIVASLKSTSPMATTNGTLLSGGSANSKRCLISK